MSANKETPEPWVWGDPWLHFRHHFPIRLRRMLPSTTEALNDAVGDLRKIAEELDCVSKGHDDLEIALREALANALIHGNAYSEGKRIFLRCYGSPGQGMLILVRDEGAGFDPGDVPDPRRDDRLHLHHGRGLFLMRELMDQVEYRRDGCEVLLFKKY